MKKKTRIDNTQKINELKSQGFDVVIRHRFRGGVGHQAILSSENPIVILKGGTNKPIQGICTVDITAPDGTSSSGTAICTDQYCRRRGVEIALGRAVKNFGLEYPISLPQIQGVEEE